MVVVVRNMQIGERISEIKGTVQEKFPTDVERDLYGSH